MNCIIYVGSYRFVKKDLLFGRNRLGLITLMFFFSTISIMTEKDIGDNVRKGFLYKNQNCMPQCRRLHFVLESIFTVFSIEHYQFL